jgi:hypothetical protein
MKAIALAQSMKAQRGLYSFFNFGALGGWGWSAPLAGHFTAGKEIIVLEAGCVSGKVGGWGGGKFSPSLGFDLRTVQPVRGRLTDYAIPNHNEGYTSIKCDCTSTIKLQIKPS